MEKVKPNAIIIDIDGVIADATHRLHHIKDGERNWEAFFDAMPADAYLNDTWSTILAETSKITEDWPFVIFLTGRPSSHYDETLAWLQEHVPLTHMTHYELLMRRKGDHRPDTEVKAELYDKLVEENYVIILAFEDRPKVARMWEEKGLKVIQVGSREEF